MTSPSSLRLHAIVASILALVFVAGASAGVAADRLIAQRTRVSATTGDMSKVFDRLGLTGEQRRDAEAIVARSAPRSHAVMMEAAERLRAVADSVDAELRAVLTPKQRLLLDSFRREPRILLKRKVVTPGGTKVDTLYDTSTAGKRVR
jgi:Spy/CpxP family protein refolding chaperone